MVDTGLVVSSAAVSEKSNEIPAMRDLVGALELHGATVTADSMHCLKETAAAVRQAGAHYVLQVKKNQLNLLKNCEGHFAEVARRRRPGESAAQVDQHKDVDKAHGRIETRKVLVSNDLRGIADASQWAACRQSWPSCANARTPFLGR